MFCFRTDTSLTGVKNKSSLHWYYFLASCIVGLHKISIYSFFSNETEPTISLKIVVSVVTNVSIFLTNILWVKHGFASSFNEESK